MHWIHYRNYEFKYFHILRDFSFGHLQYQHSECRIKFLIIHTLLWMIYKQIQALKTVQKYSKISQTDQILFLKHVYIEQKTDMYVCITKLHDFKTL